VEPADMYAALRAISRVAPASNVVLNLRGADLRNADLRFMCGTQVHLGGADLAGAKLPDDWNAPASLRATRTADLLGDLMVKVAAWRHAEPGLSVSGGANGPMAGGAPDLRRGWLGGCGGGWPGCRARRG
jgi:uncharacterized protein YjbI with pentapeptide repeats